MSALSMPPDLETANAAEWWQSCSTAELKAIVAVGVAAGERFDIAVREIERRSSESRGLAEALESERRKREAQQSRRISIAVAIAAAAAAGLFVMLLLTGAV